MISVELIGIQVDPISGSAALVLREHDAPNRLLPIIIGQADASSIAIAASGTRLPRPMTHDLMASMVDALDGHLDCRRGHRTHRRRVPRQPHAQRSCRPAPYRHTPLRRNRARRSSAGAAVRERSRARRSGCLADGRSEPFDELAIDAEVDQFRAFLAELDPTDFIDTTATETTSDGTTDTMRMTAKPTAPRPTGRPTTSPDRAAPPGRPRRPLGLPAWSACNHIRSPPGTTSRSTNRRGCSCRTSTSSSSATARTSTTTRCCTGDACIVACKLADGHVDGANLICGVHGWDYRLDSGVSSYNNDEALQRFTSWVDDGVLHVDLDEIEAWEHEHPQPYDRDAYLGEYADVHGAPEEPHVGLIQSLAAGSAGAHGPVAAMGVPRDQLPELGLDPVRHRPTRPQAAVRRRRGGDRHRDRRRTPRRRCGSTSRCSCPT